MLSACADNGMARVRQGIVVARHAFSGKINYPVCDQLKRVIQGKSIQYGFLRAFTMQYDLEKVNALIAQIYDAALDDAQWPVVVQGLAHLLKAEDSILFGSPENTSNQMIVLSPLLHAGIDAAKAYEAYYWKHDIWRAGATQHQLDYSGAIFHGDQFIDRRSFKDTEIYSDFFKPMMNGTGVVLTSIIEESAQQHPNPVVLSFYKSFSAEPFNRQDEDLIRHLMPHFQRSLLIRRKMVEEKQRRQLMEQAFDQGKDAIVLLDEACRVLFANRKAESMLSWGNLTIKQNQLFSHDSTENSALKVALHSAMRGVGGVQKFDHFSSSATRIALFSPIKAIQGEQSNTAARIMVIITEIGQCKNSELASFARLYGLTNAETRVLEQLLQQQDTREISSILNISINTLRSHLKALFAKTHTKNQRDLVNFCRSHPTINF